jgi:hypothetical protein
VTDVVSLLTPGPGCAGIQWTKRRWRALRQLPGARDAQRALPDSRKKQLIDWLQSAKTEKTLQSRIHKIMEEANGH